MPKSKSQKTEAPKWGGARPGAGRHKSDHARVRIPAMTVSQDAADRFQSFKEVRGHEAYSRAFDDLAEKHLPPAVMKYPKKG